MRDRRSLLLTTHLSETVTASRDQVRSWLSSEPHLILKIACICCTALLTLFGCSRSKLEMASPSRAEAELRETYDAIDSGNVDRLYPLICPEERRAEGLTQSAVHKLLDMFKRETARAVRGALITGGDPRSIYADALYRRQGVVVTSLSINVKVSDSGKSCAFVTKPLITATALANGDRGEGMPSNALALQRVYLQGLQNLEPELKSAGIDKFLIFPAIPSRTIEEEIGRSKKRIQLLEARGAAGSRPASR
jgi:hypothetical protein